MLPGNLARIPSDVGANSPEALHSHRSGHAALPLQVISKKSKNEKIKIKKIKNKKQCLASESHRI